MFLNDRGDDAPQLRLVSALRQGWDEENRERHSTAWRRVVTRRASLESSLFLSLSPQTRFPHHTHILHLQAGESADAEEVSGLRELVTLVSCAQLVDARHALSDSERRAAYDAREREASLAYARAVERDYGGGDSRWRRVKERGPVLLLGLYLAGVALVSLAAACGWMCSTHTHTTRRFRACVRAGSLRSWGTRSERDDSRGSRTQAGAVLRASAAAWSRAQSETRASTASVSRPPGVAIEHRHVLRVGWETECTRLLEWTMERVCL